MRLWAITLFAIILAGLRSTSQIEHGRYRGTLTASSTRPLAGRAAYTRCGNLLHIWLVDTISPDLSMEFGTTVVSLGPGSFRAQPVELLSPLESHVPGASGFFRLYVPPDTLFFADSGAMRFTGVERGEIRGDFRYVVTEAWAGRSQPVAAVVARFRAGRDTNTEHTLYRGARCDHPGAEWPRRGRH